MALAAGMVLAPRLARAEMADAKPLRNPLAR